MAISLSPPYTKAQDFTIVTSHPTSATSTFISNKMNPTKVSTALLLFICVILSANASSYASGHAKAEGNTRMVQTSFSVTGPRQNSLKKTKTRQIVICRSKCCWSYKKCGYVTKQRKMRIRSAECMKCRSECARLSAYKWHMCWSKCWRKCRITKMSTKMYTFRHPKLCPMKKVRGSCKKPMVITSRWGHRVMSKK